MKTFFTIDFYVQIVIFFVMIIYLIVEYITTDFVNQIFYFYYIVGGFQILSFIVRLFLIYKKSKFYKTYGFLLIPVWIVFLLSVFLPGKNIDLGLFNQLGVISFLMLYIAFFYAPILSVLYIFEIRQNINNYEKSNI